MKVIINKSRLLWRNGRSRGWSCNAWYNDNERISIKFEKNLLEQTYKFRDGSAIGSLEDAKTFCSDHTITEINDVFDAMSKSRSRSLNSMIENQEEKFDVII